ncbi:WD repeat-containing protein 34-like [Zootermopsis nevadensis]|uniref:WD repeat-containing protein 34 n=1 Tax=Zootermopsis nevadensis TaxID=136037 RepID=A0A067QLH3_ZOONE|nr:WD repeat-containing protein 34-like [Zootermopsis nevadensis]KDR08919.1 WD repeat-containing protein 34 [Zootermopsis nevadensis]
MFSDKSFDVVGFHSCWKTAREFQDEGIQTTASSYNEQESQSTVSKGAETQTDHIQPNLIMAENVDYDRLAAFLNRIYPKVIAELDKMHISQAFNGYEPTEDNTDGAVRKLHTLQVRNTNSQTEMKVSSLSWSCTGAVVAFACSQSKHESWCDHSGNVHLFNINRQDFSDSVPSKTLETRSCVTSLSAHPYEPSILAGGTFSGEILVWNLQKDDDCLISTTVTVPGAHREAVSQVSWVRNPDPTQQRHVLVSAGRDGRLLMWQVGTHSGSIQLIEGFFIMLEHIKYTGPSKAVPSPVGGPDVDMELGVTCFSFAAQDLTTFVVGVDGGGLLHCTTIATKPAPVHSEVPLKDPVLNTFEKHEGAVTCVKCSPHHAKTFISCGTDNEIRIYHMNQTAPVRVIYVEAGVVGLEWSLAHPDLFGAWGNISGCVNFYNLNNGEIIPSLQLPACEKPALISAVCCNPHSHQLVAVGDVQGKVVVWQQPSYKEDK